MNFSKKESISLNTSNTRKELIKKFKTSSGAVNTKPYIPFPPLPPPQRPTLYKKSINNTTNQNTTYLDGLPSDFSTIEESVTPHNSDEINYTSNIDENENDEETLVNSYSPTPPPTLSPRFDPIFPNKPITVCICPYYINDTIINPFYEYLFTWNEETKHAEFPKKIINLQISTPNNINIENPSHTPANFTTPITHTTSSPHTSVKTQIMNEAIEFILDLFELHDTFNQEVLDEMFKGFIWLYESHTVYLFFNIFNKKTTFPTTNETTPAPQYKWAILDEIINKQYIANKNAPVLPEIINLFKENTFLKTLYINNENNSLHKIPLEYPRCLYLCENQNGTDSGEDTPIIWKNVAEDGNDYFIENTVNYSLLGDFYYFSNDPIEPVDDTPTLSPPWKDDDFKRYAVFLNIYNGEYTIEESYIVKDTTTITKEQWEHYFSKTEQSNVSTIWFKERELQLWAIKYPNQFYSIC